MERYKLMALCTCICFASCAGGNGSTASSEPQATTQPAVVSQKSFKGHWVGARASYDVIDISTDGSLTIVSSQSEGRDIFKTPGVPKNDNTLVINIGGGETPLTLCDDGSKLYFGGSEYIKR